MPVVKINQLPEGSGTLSNDDIFIFMDNPSGGGTTKKISLSEISSAIGGGGGSSVTIANSGDNRVLTSTGSTSGINAEANLTFNGSLLTSPSGNITTINSIPTYLSPSALSADTNNWDPGYGDIVRVSGTTTGIDITGLVAPTGIGTNYLRVLINIGSANNLTLKHDVTSTAGNRFLTPTGGDHIIPPSGTATILYDTTSSRWRVL